jgi:hypothetical protein
MQWALFLPAIFWSATTNFPPVSTGRIGVSGYVGCNHWHILFNVYIVSVVAVAVTIKNCLFVVMVHNGCSTVGKISISVSISKKPGKYRGNIVSNEKAGIAYP